jgi:hypothetical protein
MRHEEEKGSGAYIIRFKLPDEIKGVDEPLSTRLIYLQRVLSVRTIGEFQ